MSDETVVRVAVLAEEPLGYGSGKHYFPVILNGYSWAADPCRYRMTCEYVWDRDVLEGRLTTSSFDVLLVPGGGVGDGEAVTKGLTIRPKVRRFKRRVNDFIASGGGYVGICGGAALMTGLSTPRGPRSLLERLYDASALGASCVQSYYHDLSLPLLTFRQRRYPERVGATAYVFSFEPGETLDGKRIHTGGVPVDFPVEKDNPLFADYDGEQVRMRWWGGPGLLPPDRPDRRVSVLARYPTPDFSSEPATRIYAWRYAGGIAGLLRAARAAIRMKVREGLPMGEIIKYIYYLAGRWERSDRTIDLDCAGKACITTEVYPNENEGRILLSAPHPEYMVWWGGEIEEAEASDEVCLGWGMRRWKGITPLSETLQEELTHTWWVVRRMAAWAGKVPEADMPPIEKGAIDEQARAIIETNVFWDGTFADQMHNI